MEKLTKKNLLLVSLMLFSMFFGAGNLIFPPYLGQLAGTNMVVAMAGFLISAVGLPILAVAVVAKAGGLNKLASRVHPIFALVFTTLIYLSIGPFLGIPRAASLAFEMGVSPFLSKNLTGSAVPLLIYTLAYFSLSFWLCMTPSKLVDRFGKVLTPILLILISSVFAFSLIKPIGGLSAPSGDYVHFSLLKGFLDGYMTMDAIAALNFGIVISLTLKEMGIKDKKSLISNTISAGLIAGLFLTIIYGMLSYLGGCAQTRFGGTENGAQTLTNVVFYLFGQNGAVLLGLIFSLACLTTSVGLITSCSEYFATLIPRISYRTWVVVLCVSSMTLANVGLTKILSISVPVLTAIYPMAIILIVLAFANDLFKGSQAVYLFSMLFTSFVSISEALGQFGINVKLINHLPLYSKGLGWLIPAIVGIMVGLIYDAFRVYIIQNDTLLKSDK